MTIIGPGDDDTYKLVNKMTVTGGETMHIESGDVTQLVYLAVQGRTLASAGDVGITDLRNDARAGRLADRTTTTGG